METVKPFVKCVDFWLSGIPPEKMKIYKELITENQIRKHTVIVNQGTGSTTVEYYAIAPHKWILEEMKRRCSQ